uniref:Uncharacterized protein n=1 Tax=Oryza meridionalis TaxID=40149 RepID=A0A0E0DKQ9_9ORYZ
MGWSLGPTAEGAVVAAAERPRLRPASCEVAKPREEEEEEVRRSGALVAGVEEQSMVAIATGAWRKKKKKRIKSCAAAAWRTTCFSYPIIIVSLYVLCEQGPIYRSTVEKGGPSPTLITTSIYSQ